MAISEAGMLGTEVTESVAEGATETIEIGSEVLAEVGAGVAFDAIPVIGELAMGTMLIVAWVESLIKHYEPIRHEHEEAHIISGGRYNLPLFPSFTTYANDLNGAKDKVSYLMYLSKRFDAGVVRSYLEEHHLTEHIDKSYFIPLLRPNDAHHNGYVANGGDGQVKWRIILIVRNERPVKFIAAFVDALDQYPFVAVSNTCGLFHWMRFLPASCYENLSASPKRTCPPRFSSKIPPLSVS